MVSKPPDYTISIRGFPTSLPLGVIALESEEGTTGAKPKRTPTRLKLTFSHVLSFFGIKLPTGQPSRREFHAFCVKGTHFAIFFLKSKSSVSLLSSEGKIGMMNAQNEFGPCTRSQTNIYAETFFYKFR